MRIRVSRSRILKRTQKGSEGEPTGSGLSAVNDMSSEILYLLDPAQGLFMLEGNISRRVLASCQRRPVLVGNVVLLSARATHHVIKATSETLKFLDEL